MQSGRPISFSRGDNGDAYIGGCLVNDLVKDYGSPLYILDQQTIIDNCRSYTVSLSQYYPHFRVMYAGKANLTMGLLDLLASEGIGVDVSSGGELYTALQSNMKSEDIIFHGNNKSIEELQLAIDHQVTIMLDNDQELDHIMQYSSKTQPTKVMVRLKPGIEANTHDYIKTGHSESKFGFNLSDMVSVVKTCHESDRIQFLGIHAHIGSQLFDPAPYMALVDCMVGHLVTLKQELGIDVHQLNLGGGVGIKYTEADHPLPISDFMTTLSQRLVQRLDEKGLSHPLLMLEPGRSIVGNAGVTVYTIGAIKSVSKEKTYVFVDGGMADNPRPLIYHSEHLFELVRGPVNGDHSDNGQFYAIAGKFCESGDVLAQNVLLDSPESGDLLMVYGTGAYNYSMASNYNRARRLAMILVNQGQSQILVQRESFEDLVRLDRRLERL